jgi:hypothetical protein
VNVDNGVVNLMVTSRSHRTAFFFVTFLLLRLLDVSPLLVFVSCVAGMVSTPLPVDDATMDGIRRIDAVMVGFDVDLCSCVQQLLSELGREKTEHKNYDFLMTEIRVY